MFVKRIAKICRLCLKHEGEMTSIFQTNDREGDSSLAERIISVAPIQINPNDGLPTLICQECTEQVNKFYDFQILVEMSDRSLRACIYAEQYESCEGSIKAEPFEGSQYSNDIVTDGGLLPMNAILIPTEDSIQIWKVCNSDDLQQTIEVPQVHKIVQTGAKTLTNLSYIIDGTNIEKVDDLSGIQCALKEELDVDFLECMERYEEEHEEPELLSSGDKISCELCSEVFQSLKDLKDHISEHFVVKKTKVQNDMGSGETVEEAMHVPNSIEGIGIRDMTVVQIDGGTVLAQNPGCEDKFLSYSLVCVHCNRTFTSNKDYALHSKKHFPRKPYKCKVCEKTFAKIASCRYHEKNHSQESKHFCLECGKSFLKKSELKYHKGSHVKTPPMCNICNKHFQNIQSFKIHMKRHTLGSRFVCNTCGKSYYTNSELARHVQMHSGKREYPCQICEMSFLSKPELNRHLKYHTGEKKFKCNVCFKSYYESGHLKIHERVHTGERPFACITCGKSFVSRSKLIRHVKIHNKNEMEMCNIFPTAIPA